MTTIQEPSSSSILSHPKALRAFAKFNRRRGRAMSKGGEEAEQRNDDEETTVTSSSESTTTEQGDIIKSSGQEEVQSRDDEDESLSSSKTDDGLVISLDLAEFETDTILVQANELQQTLAVTATRVIPGDYGTNTYRFTQTLEYDTGVDMSTVHASLDETTGVFCVAAKSRSPPPLQLTPAIVSVTVADGDEESARAPPAVGRTYEPSAERRIYMPPQIFASDIGIDYHTRTGLMFITNKSIPIDEVGAEYDPKSSIRHVFDAQTMDERTLQASLVEGILIISGHRKQVNRNIPVERSPANIQAEPDESNRDH